MEVKAFLLAAGEGKRLRPLTDNLPKCLVPIQGRPLLHYWLSQCEEYGIQEVLINLHHLPGKVEEFVAKNSYGVRIKLFFEENLLGSGGTIVANRDFVRGEEAFFIFYADNLTNMNLVRMLNFHRGQGGFFTMGLFRTNKPQECGIAQMNEKGVITEFIEKPKNPKGNLANAGIYLAGPELFDYFPDKVFIDFGFDVLPRLVGKMFGYVSEEYLIDIGTLENYEKAQREWPEITTLGQGSSLSVKCRHS